MSATYNRILNALTTGRGGYYQTAGNLAVNLGVPERDVIQALSAQPDDGPIVGLSGRRVAYPQDGAAYNGPYRDPARYCLRARVPKTHAA